jgi:hypothetical protein
MPRTCTICTHPERDVIDAALVAGEAFRRVAARYKVTEQAIRRHRKAHLPEVLIKAQEAAEAARADDLLAQLRDLTAEAHRIKDRAERTGDYRTALAGIRELVRIVELLAKLRGELDERPQLNVLVVPQWLAVRAALVAALASYPEARAAVAEQLLALEAGNDHRR